MIHPTFQVNEEMYIHAAREAVWAHWVRVGDWPRWRTDVSRATWIAGQPWQEGASFVLQPSGAGAGEERYLIRMVVPADTTVWETGRGGQEMVYSLRLVDQVGGCKVLLRCTFHGWGSLLKRLNTAGETARLQAMLAALKVAVERPDSRR